MEASGVLTYNTPIISARAEPGGPASPAFIGSLSPFISSAHPHTGKLIEGWKWDERAWSSEITDNIVMSVPGNWDATIDDLPETYFQSGMGSNRDIQLEQILSMPSSGLNAVKLYNIWAPEVYHGWYYEYSEVGYLFSDDSEVLYASYSGVVPGIGFATASGFNEIELLSHLKVGTPVTVQRWRWMNEDGRHVVDLDLRKKVHFTGLLEGTQRLETYDDVNDTIIWDNIDRSEPEFVIVDSGVLPRIVTNSQYIDVYPPDSGLEELGLYDGGAGQQYFTTFAPIDDTMGDNGIEVYSYLTQSGEWTQWSPIEMSDEFSPGSGIYEVRLDPELGILEFGDPGEPGVNVPNLGHVIATRYYRGLRCEYEPLNSIDTILATEASLNPIYRQTGRGFVYLRTKIEEPTSIHLTAELPEGSPNLFGPLPIGNTFAPVIATVRDKDGNALEDATVTFEITSIPVAGSFGTVGNFATSATGSTGQARAFYNPPRGISEIGETITGAGYVAESNPPEYAPLGITHVTRLTTQNLLLEGDLGDISLYKVFVDDAIQGVFNTTLPADTSVQTEDYYKNYFAEHGIYGPTGLTPPDLVTQGSLSWEYNHRLMWNLLRPSIFNPLAGGGRRVLVAQWDNNAINPHTFEEGAVAPVRPLVINTPGSNQFELVYDTSSLSIPPPSGDLYGYFVVAPTSVTIQASVFNERLNRTITSNEIRIRLSIPPYLNGVWIVDAINQSHLDEISELLENVAIGSSIPFGFRLRTTNITLAGALDGVTFVDVNPPFKSNVFDLDDVTPARHQVTVSNIT